MNKKRILRRVGLVSGVVAAVCSLYLSAVYFVLFRPSFLRRSHFTEESYRRYFVEDKYYEDFKKNKDWFFSLKPELISITSYDGLNLKGYLIEQNEAQGTVILMHGYQSEPLREWLNIVRYYFDNNWNIIVPYQRTHGLSEGKYITFGVKERYDCRDWINEANRRFGTESSVFIHGISMGCATVVMTLGFELPKNVRGCIADCGFTTPREIIYTVVHDERHIPFSNLIVATGDMMTRLFAGFSLDDYSTYKALKNTRVPVLFIHGTGDDFVPMSMTIKNFEACLSSKMLYLSEGRPHAITNILDRGTYTDKLTLFLSKFNNNR